MARLAFFTEQLPANAGDALTSDAVTEFSYGLMLSLADQQHDVRVFSTYRATDQMPASHPRLQIMRPFRKWSWLEIPRLVPILLDFQPEILHFIQPRREVFSGLTNAMSLLPSLAPVIGRPRVVMSLYDVRREELRRNKTLLSMVETVIVANQQQAEELTAWLRDQPRRPTIEIVSLPTASDSAETEIESVPALENMRELAKTFIFIPGELDEQRDLPALAAVFNELLTLVPSLGLVIGGGWGRLNAQQRRSFMRQFEDRGNGARILLTGPLSAEGESACLKAADLVFLAGLQDSSLAFARWVRQGLHYSKPLIINETQCAWDPMNWRNRENAFIVNEDVPSWGSTLAEAVMNEPLRREIRLRLPDFARTEVVDEPGNAMSRIYAQVLRSPRKPLR